jgi:hypothetical protein
MSLSSDKKSYTITINSEDRIDSSSSKRNNCTFNIAWDQVLPREYDDFKLAFSFGTSGGIYKDTGSVVYSCAKVYVDFGSKAYNFDSNTGAQGNMIGLINRDIQTTGTSSNTLSCWYLYNAPRTITKPYSNFMTVKIMNQSTNTLLTNTDAQGTPVADMTSWTMILELIPITENKEIAGLL